ncbi:TorF family putative porin [Tepidimonas taiwanensis]|uniref:Uncharacterized protein n=2 Tax=Tepidimonas taiwanensis TaxID=307486 RepID=A0A554X807_9BURK|nr:TorF family putative porin [Tepidimonas taiwanensis]TSE31962.1 hypothetical protein Ttaiw_01381 [Tepidimonas taiwanensis]UBQ06270.1 TorF family putative porin [Tepidimonas taiwanensis]
MNAFTYVFVVVLLAVMFGPGVAKAEVSGSLGVVSLYKFNGIDVDSRSSRNNNGFNPSLQGDIRYSFDNGFYLGAAFSTGKFSDGINQANVEIDAVVGLTGGNESGVSYDVSVARYYFPGVRLLTVNEVNASVSYGWFAIRFGRTFGGKLESFERLAFVYSQPIDSRLSFVAEVGKLNSLILNRPGYFSVGVVYDLGEGWALSGVVTGAQNKAGPEGRKRIVLGVKKQF